MQVALHWIVVVLVAFQFLAHAGIEERWRALMRSETPVPQEVTPLAFLHIAAGVLILLLALMRIYLRIARGVPEPPADEPRILHLVAEAVHGSIYVLLILLPISGMIAWFLRIEFAGDLHEMLKNILLGAIALHIAGALFQHFVRRSDILIRMFQPKSG